MKLQQVLCVTYVRGTASTEHAGGSTHEWQM